MNTLAFCRPQMDLRLFCRLLRKNNLLLRLAFFQGQDAGEDLRGARIGQFFLPVFVKKNTPGIRIHQDRRPGIKRSRLLHFLCPHKAGFLFMMMGAPMAIALGASTVITLVPYIIHHCLP